MRTNISEQMIDEAVKASINEMIGEITSIPYDPNMLDGIDSIDNRSINLYIQSMIMIISLMIVKKVYYAQI